MARGHHPGPAAPGRGPVSARCEMTELPVDMCAHCRGGDVLLGQLLTTQPGRDGQPGPTVEARWAGLCASCGTHYPAGTPIRRGPDGWTADCCEET